MSLESIAPETALDLYLADRETELSQATLYSHRSRIGHFIRWCDKQEIEDLNDLSGRDLHRYRLWRRNEGELAPTSEKTQMDTLRVFIRWLEAIDGVSEDLSTKVQSPALDANDNVRDVMLEDNRVEEILDYLAKFEYATIEHVCIELLWHTMMRVGALRALDVRDYNAKDQYLSILHRPETNTPIKNKEDGERLVALSGDICNLLDDWLENKRPDVTDEYDRSPLIATAQGRAHTTTLRSYVYAWTRPCKYETGCPHDRSLDECPARNWDKASQCPSSVSPHAIRRGSITNSLNKEVPEKVVSDRADVNPTVIDKHYDKRTKREKMERRRKFLGNI